MDRVEYMIWRDTIRYKYQLDKALQLSEQEIEDIIDELEKTMSESMPYFFEGKDDDIVLNDLSVNPYKGFYTMFDCFTVLKDDWRKWCKGELFFCAECFHTLSQYIKYPEKPHKGDMTTKEYANEMVRFIENERQEYMDKTKPYRELTRYPLRPYNDIINVYRQSEYYCNYDYTNPKSVMKLLADEHIMTSYDEFSNQIGYEAYNKTQKLPNGIEIVTFWHSKEEYH